MSGKSVTERQVAGAVVPPRVPAPQPAETVETPSPAGIPEIVSRIAAQHSLPAELIHTMIQVESNYNPYAVSHKGAQGLMQLIPATARRFGVADVFNPVDNIQGGARYLRYLLDLYSGNYPLALAAYNAGEGAVAKYGNVPPYPETQTYLQRVGRRLVENQKAAAAQPKPVKDVPPAQAAGRVTHVQEVVEGDGTVHYVSK